MRQVNIQEQEQEQEQESEPDLTPMLDVVFIMLIFFIVTATFVRETGLDLPGDNSEPQTVNAEKSLIVQIAKDDRFYVNKKHIDRRALVAYLSALNAQNPQAPMVIMPDGTATTDSLVFALDVGRLLGLDTSISVGES